MNFEQFIECVAHELEQAEKKHPNFPTDIVHGVAIMAEESGEAVQAALHCHYEGGNEAHLVNELVQTSAMCFRLIKSISDKK